MTTTDERITVYVTQWALTTGIRKMLARRTCIPQMIELVSNSQYKTHVFKPHWCLTREQAIVQAKLMQAERIVSLEKSLAKMKALKFDEPKQKED